jgi:osmotically-inducible protein OsmY
MEGVVSLSGVVDSYAKKMVAENAAKKVIGLSGLVENIEVKFHNTWSKTDGEIATEVINALKNSWIVPSGKISIKVENGWVTLDGELPWNFQREAAKDAIHYLHGIKGVNNNIKIKTEIKEAHEQKQLEDTISRNWSIDFSNIEVSVSGATATLSGSVISLYQKQEAGMIAWDTPGIWNVKNELLVDSLYASYDY